MINELVKKLRKAADALDDLLESIPANNKKAVKQIHKSMDKSLEKDFLHVFNEGFNDRAKKKKLHWTKLPKNKAKVRKLLKKMRIAKKVKPNV